LTPFGLMMWVNRKPSSVAHCPDQGFDVVANSGHVVGPFRPLGKGDGSPDNINGGKGTTKLGGISSYINDAEGNVVSKSRNGDSDPENDWYYQDPTMEGYKPAGIKRDSHQEVSPDGNNLAGKKPSSGQRNSFKNVKGDIPQKIQMNSKGFKMGAEDPNANMVQSGLTGTGSILNPGVTGIKASKGKGAIINLQNNGIERPEIGAIDKNKNHRGSTMTAVEDTW
jgi:hypothetical protein